MKALNHDQARYILHVGREHVSVAERDLLNQHMSECSICRNYADEVNSLNSTISRVMHMQLDAATPSVLGEDKMMRSMQRKIAQKRMLAVTNSLLSGAVVLGLIIAIAWLFESSRPPTLPTGSGAVMAQGNPVQFEVCGESKTWTRPTQDEENQKWWTFARYADMDRSIRESYWTRDFFVAYGNPSPEFDTVNLSGLWTLPDGVRGTCLEPARQEAVLKLETAEIWVLLHSVKDIRQEGTNIFLVVKPTSTGVQFVQFPRPGPSPMSLHFVTPEGQEIAQINEYKSPDWPYPSILPTPTP